MFRKSILFAGLLAAPLASATVAQGKPAAYTAATAIPMSDGRWDLASYDGAHNRVAVARGGSVTIADLATGSAHDIGTVAGGHAALFIPGMNTVAVTSGQDDTLRLLDLDTGKQIGSIPVGKKPDASIWDPLANGMACIAVRPVHSLINAGIWDWRNAG